MVNFYDELKNNNVIMTKTVRHSFNSVEYVGDELLNDLEFIKEIINICGIITTFPKKLIKKNKLEFKFVFLIF